MAKAMACRTLMSARIGFPVPIGFPVRVWAPELISIAVQPLAACWYVVTLLALSSAPNCVAVTPPSSSSWPLRRAATAASLFEKYCEMRVSNLGAPMKKSLLAFRVAYWFVLLAARIHGP